MAIKAIVVLVFLNIILPTYDTWGDLNLVYKLFRGAQYCDSDAYLKCNQDKTSYCSIAKENDNQFKNYVVPCNKKLLTQYCDSDGSLECHEDLNSSCRKYRYIDGYYVELHGDDKTKYDHLTFCDNEFCNFVLCRHERVRYCSNVSNVENNRTLCHEDLCDYLECRHDPVSYCSMAGNNQTLCRFSSHPKMATLMLIPFLLNYFVCFITFFRKEKNKKFTFIFALLPLYPQFGMNSH